MKDFRLYHWLQIYGGFPVRKIGSTIGTLISVSANQSTMHSGGVCGGYCALIEVSTHVGLFKTFFAPIIAFVTRMDPVSLVVMIRNGGNGVFGTQ